MTQAPDQDARLPSPPPPPADRADGDAVFDDELEARFHDAALDPAAGAEEATDLAPQTPDDGADAIEAESRRRTMRRRMRDTWHMVNGLVTIPDLLSKLGFWLYRGTMKRTIAVAIALMSVYVAGSAAQRDLITAKQAFNATGAILMISFLGGLLLMALSGSVARSQLTLGEAKGSNLLEEMKKSRAVEHRDRFWLRVFQYEARLAPLQEVELERKLIDSHRTGLVALCHPNTRRDLGDDRLGHLRAVLRALGRTREGWNLIFDYACQAPMSRTVLKHRLRYDLSKVKDWYDGAPFHHSDTKLPEQFAAAENLQLAKKEAGLDWWFLFWHTRKRLLQAMWFRMITRAVQLRVAQACRALDKKYPAHHFGPDQFLWPTREAYEVIKAEAGERALDDVIEMRQRILQRVLSPDPDLAIGLMQKAIYPNFEVASQLRRLYDPQYVLGDLNETWLDDLRAYDRAFRPREKREAKRRHYTACVRRQQKALDAFLKTHTIEGADDPEALRSVRIAVHVNRDGLCDALCGEDGDGRRKTDADPRVVIHDAIREKREYTRKLLAVRTHHELARIELEDYECYLNRILH